MTPGDAWERARAEKDARMEAERRRWRVIDRECWERMLEVDRFARSTFGRGIEFPDRYPDLAERARRAAGSSPQGDLFDQRSAA